ncbi:secretory calcium-binding phosphoprotein 9 isoform 1-T1 [Clarias gariepinus]|uniref:secretory calcium-binding phosphoprotein 9 isoform X1 n=1 Tax=Clarias gariepinus TaxID=13013 RepID=UPI00234CDBFA|nr:secretory calcium-binding phosphoprotein 9 isoform X1 [Clarias gariepinus]
MKIFLFAALLASAAYVISAKKLLVVGGLNGLNPGVVGLNPGVVGLNPGVVGLNGGLLNPGLVVGGVNPALIGAGGPFIGQPALAPMIPPYMFQPQFGFPNPMPQLPQQFPVQPNGGLPFMNPVNRQVLPPQQQAAGQMNPNGQQPQGDMPAGPAQRFRRALWARMQDNSVAQATVSPATTKHPDE